MSTSSQKTVQVGRVVRVNYGADAGKLAVIVDILDQNRALVDGPTTKVPRQALTFKRMSLTPITVDIPRSIGSKCLAKKIQAQDMAGKWAATEWAKKLDKRERRANLSDFDRFKVIQLKKKRAEAMRISKRAQK